MSPRIRIPLIVILALLAVISGALVLSHGALNRATAQVQPQDPTVLARAFGIHFNPVVGASDSGPTLPNGSMGISKTRAIQAAVPVSAGGVDYVNKTILPNVDVTAQYGLFSNDRYGHQLSPGHFVRFLQSRPVWVVTFSGPGVHILPGGPAPSGAVHSETSVVIDAATVEYLYGYSYR